MPEDIARAVGSTEEHDALDIALATLQLEAPRTSSIDPQTLLVDAPIGMGGYGAVFLCTDPPSKRHFALKMLRKGLLATRSDLPTRALREKQALEELHHPFISSCHMTFQDEESLYFLLELATGRDLYSLFDTHPTIPEEWARFYVACLALALRHMHEHSFVYRDMKPENVLLDGSGYVCLADFGFARKAEGRTFTACGTDEYVPPELLDGKGRSAASDWWGLGVLLHEMVAGHTPFEGDPAQVYDQIASYCKRGRAAQEALVAALRDVSAECADVVAGLLVAEEGGRYGCRSDGFLDIQRHAWFKELSWCQLLQRELAAPHVPPPFDPIVAMVEPEPLVMKSRPYDKAVVDPQLHSFGPKISLCKKSQERTTITTV